jgi:hypothetical protein
MAGQDVRFRADVGGRGQADLVAAEDLQAPELVPAARDRLAFVRAEKAHLLEVTHHGDTEKSDRGADPGDDRIRAGKRLAPIEQRGRRAHRHGEERGVVDARLVTSLERGLEKAASAVEVRFSRKDSDSHCGRFG